MLIMALQVGAFGMCVSLLGGVGGFGYRVSYSFEASALFSAMVKESKEGASLHRGCRRRCRACNLAMTVSDCSF